MNNLLPGKGATKHPARLFPAWLRPPSPGAGLCQSGFDMDSGEFRSQGVGPQPRGWHSSARMGMTEPLGSQGAAHAWLPALLGHGAAWHSDCPCSPSSSPAEMILVWDSARTAPRHHPLPGAHALSWHQESTS